MSSQRIQVILKEYHLNVKIIEFKQLTRTAQEAALAIGCEIGQIAKTLIFKGKSTGNPICIIASGKNRVSESKIEQIIGEEIEKPDAGYVLEHTSFVIGGVPPIGYTFEIMPLIDEDLLIYGEIWAAAGTPHSCFQLTIKDLFRMTQGRVVDLRQ